MKSFTTYVSLLQSMAKVPSTDSTNTALLTTFLNDSIRTMCNIRGGKWWWLETTETQTTNSADTIKVPANIRKITSVTVTVGTTIYTPTPVFDSGIWNTIQAADLGESDTPQYYYRNGDEVLFAPTQPTGNTVTIRGRLRAPDLSNADYTTGTITSVVGGGTQVNPLVTGSGTTWTTQMAGRYIKITGTNAVGTGDNRWYKIYRVDSATSLTLTQPYEGTTLAAATATYTIGEMTPIPEAYDMAPVYRALALYSQVNDPLHPSVATIWWRLYDGGQEAGLANVPGGLIGQMIENESSTVEASYISPNSVSHNNLSDEPEEITGL